MQTYYGPLTGITPFTNLNELPVPGVEGTLYIRNNYLYEWDDLNKSYYIAYVYGGDTNSSLVDLTGIADGSILKAQNGKIVGTQMYDRQGDVFSAKKIRVESGTLDIGPAISTKERGGYLQTHVNTTNRDFISVDYLVNESGSQPPTYDKRAPAIITEVQADKSQIMADVKTITLQLNGNRDIFSIWLDFATESVNFRALVRSNATNLPIKYYPTEDAFLDGRGVIASGEFQIIPETPIAWVDGIGLIFELYADGPVNLKGNGTLPYIKVKKQDITPLKLIDSDDISNYVQTFNLDSGNASDIHVFNYDGGHADKNTGQLLEGGGA